MCVNEQVTVGAAGALSTGSLWDTVLNMPQHDPFGGVRHLVYLPATTPLPSHHWMRDAPGHTISPALTTTL